MEENRTPETPAGTPTPAQLEQIGAYARRQLKPEEVYVFSLVLCDNLVDREYERFPRESLEKLAGLFLGRTGIFDHNPTGEGQTARIFATALEEDPAREAPAGEPYCALRAWAYMVRCPRNADLILEIEAGIKKEVSVGCAVARSVCSVCGADARQAPCAHQKGRTYSGQLCWQDLVEPLDAYEWSFVAVPAQRGAGVTKGAAPGGEAVRKGLARGRPPQNPQEALALDAHIQKLEQLAQAGERYLEGRRRQLVRLAALALPGVAGQVVAQVAKGMDPEQLEAFCRGLARRQPGLPLLAPAPEGGGADDRAFLV